MDGLRDPVGGRPTEVYWRRRIVAATGVALLLVVIFFLATSPGGSDNKLGTSATNSPAPTVSADSTAAATDGSTRACNAADVQLTVTPNPRDFAAGALPVFDVDIKQVGATPCKLDTAADGTELLITSGSDRVFSSLDCPTDATISSQQFLLQAGATETIQVTWNRQRSVPECTTVSSAPGAGTYHAVLTVQGIESNDATFTLAN